MSRFVSFPDDPSIGHEDESILLDDLYDYLQIEPCKRVGRPPKDDGRVWRVVDDWPQEVPVTKAEVDLFEAWFGDVFDEMFGACP